MRHHINVGIVIIVGLLSLACMDCHKPVQSVKNQTLSELTQLRKLLRMGKLQKKQSEFAKCIWYLEGYIMGMGFEITYGDAFRSPKAIFPYSHKNSCHKYKLARDYNFFKDGIYITDPKVLEDIGDYWESLDERARWGGRWGDTPHFSFEHNGVR